MDDLANIESRTKRPERSILRITIALIAWLAAAGALGSRYFQAMDRPGFDFYEFWLVGDLVREHRNADQPRIIDIYSAQAQHDLGVRYANRSFAGSSRQRQVSKIRMQLDNVCTPFLCWVFGFVTTPNYDQS